MYKYRINADHVSVSIPSTMFSHFLDTPRKKKHIFAWHFVENHSDQRWLSYLLSNYFLIHKIKVKKSNSFMNLWI